MSFVTEVEYRQFLVDALRSEWDECVRCPLAHGSSRVVHGYGNPAADLGIVGEAPGEEEDRRGLPFVGQAGALLRILCRKLGIDLALAWITNVVACQPTANRDPRAEERSACRPRLEQELAIVRPRVLLLLGRVAMASLLEVPSSASLKNYRGRVRDVDLWPKVDGWHGLEAVVVTYHPSWVLRQETKQKKRVALSKLAADLRKVERALKGAA